MNIRKKTFVLIITYLAAAIAALDVYTALHYGMERSYRRTAEYGYAHSFEELVYAASGLESALHRASYATGAELSGELCADIYADCLAAEMSMAALPFSTQELERTAAFIGLAGDYAHSRLRASAQSGFDDAARQRFAELYETAARLNRELSTLRDSINDGEVLLDEPENVFASSGDRLSGRMLGMEDGIGVTELGAYGGRYAEEPAQERSKAAIPQAEAKAAAADFSASTRTSWRSNTRPLTARSASASTAAAYVSMRRAACSRSAPSAASPVIWAWMSLSARRVSFWPPTASASCILSRASASAACRRWCLTACAMA